MAIKYYNQPFKMLHHYSSKSSFICIQEIVFNG